MPRRLLMFVAAESREFAGVLKTVPVHPLDWGLRFACQGDLNGNTAVFVADGPGPRLAGAAADRARSHISPDMVVSTGFCGALDPELKHGDVLIATEVIDRETGATYPARDPGGSAPASRGTVLSMDRVADTVAFKKELRLTGARAVEMEAAAVASRAVAWGVPFYCVRGVSDGACEGFAIDFNRMRDATGRFSRPRIILAALARPWSRIPSLLSLDRSCRIASQSLGEFFADCRF